MDSFFAKNRLSAYIDGTLSAAEADEVTAAIAHDPALRVEYEELKAAVHTLRTLGPVAAPEGFHARVMAAIDKEPTQRGMVVQFRRLVQRMPIEALAVAAAALLVVFAAAPQLQGTDTPAPPPPTPPPSADATAPAEGASLAASPPPPTEVAKEESKKDDASPALIAPQPSTPPERSTSASGRKSAAMPDAAYVPEWEDGGTHALGGTEHLELVVTDPDVLQKLHLLTERQQGRMMDDANRPLRPYALSADNPVARVLLLVPLDNAGALRTQLTGLGATPASSPSGSATLAAGYSGFFVELRFAQ